MHRPTMARVLQINLNHCIMPKDILFQLVQDKKADIVVISE